MSSSSIFTKQIIDQLFKELGKEFRKLNGKNMPAEIIVVGGASILINYGFREMTYDIDAFIIASSAMKEAINRISDKYCLPNGWLNTDFTKTKSFTPKLREYSKYYKTYSNILTVRTVSSEYLVAMKLMSNRHYRNDLSDIVGILYEQKKNGHEISFQSIDKAVKDLYGDWNRLPSDSKEMIINIFEENNLEELYRRTKNEEIQNKEILIEFDEKYPEVVGESNVQEILTKLKNLK